MIGMVAPPYSTRFQVPVHMSFAAATKPSRVNRMRSGSPGTSNDVEAASLSTSAQRFFSLGDSYDRPGIPMLFCIQYSGFSQYLPPESVYVAMRERDTGAPFASFHMMLKLRWVFV